MAQSLSLSTWDHFVSDGLKDLEFQVDTVLRQQTNALVNKNKNVIVVNLVKKIINASSAIQTSIPEWSSMSIANISEHGQYIQMEIPVNSPHNGRLIGFTLFLEPIPADESPLHQTQHTSFRFLGEPGISTIFQKTLLDIQRVAPTDATVFITGETGTGKEIIARSIHESSSRKDGPFIAVNCGAIPRDLMGSELFGYLDGAFTGARRSGYKGKFEQAHKGTIFLDEVSELTPAMQVSLLRVLQDRKVTPLGSTKEKTLDIRILAATHKDLPELVRRGLFREDLFYRIFVYPIHVPPLRKRKEDIPFLASHFCKRKEWNVFLSQPFLMNLQSYDWPGNVRELFNLLERLYIFSQGQEMDLFEVYQRMNGDDRLEMHGSDSIVPASNSKESEAEKLNTRDTIIKEMMIAAIQNAKGNVKLAAKIMGVPRSTFYKRIRKYKL
ncbi:sigma-54 interaction domain-containing protein [Neobacillus sp. LXY-4]|uniref:sigma-54 interaction domain-containing protein n=1 Tax=Neobacillus sp. LXY-4 TaxID=3379826 RepID=UPI003EE09725